MICTACGSESPSDHAYCGRCGALLPTATAHAERRAGERRQLTVLFCDIVGSTALSAALDPEDWQEFVAEYQATCTAGVSRYSGHVAQYLGDGVLAYFGFPNAHEDDPERAVRAALDILAGLAPLRRRMAQEQGQSFASRIGVHTGRVVVGAVGGRGREEHLALGDTPNIAARLQELAEPDTVLISDVTARRIGARLQADALGPKAVRGVPEPIAVHRVRGLAGEVARGPRVGPPLIGRARELGTLRSAFEAAKRGTGQLVLLAGEAGIGKTRLLEALREELAGESHDWLYARCSAYRQGNPLHPFSEALRSQLGVSEDADPATVQAALARALPGDDDARVVLAGLLGATPDGDSASAPERLPKLRIEALLRWLLSLAGRRPLVLAVEDLHWADPTSLELVAALSARLSGAALLCIPTARPELTTLWPGEAKVERVSLARLSSPEIEALVREVWQGPVAPELAARVAARADGVPLFAEEIAKAVRDREPGELSIPETLQDSLNARLDRLGPARALAQRAAVIGREFSRELLDALYLEEAPDLEQELRALIRAEIVQSVGGEGRGERFEFKHGLIRDAAYAGILRRDRRSLHARVSDALEVRFRERARRSPEVVAHHACEAGRPLRALTEWHRAARRAARAGARAEALAHVERAFEQLPAVEARAEREQQELGLVMTQSGIVVQGEGFSEQYMTLVRRADALCAVLGFPVLRPWLLAGISTYHAVRGETAECLRFAEEALALAQQHPTAPSIANSHLSLARARLCHGEYATALGHADAAIRVYRREDYRASVTGGPDIAVAARSYGGLARFALGDSDGGMADCLQALADAESARPEDPISQMTALELASWLRIHRGEGERALSHAERALEIAWQLGDSRSALKLELVRECARVSAQPTPGAVDALERIYAEWEKTGGVLMSTFYLGVLAQGLCAVGRLDNALVRSDEALRRANELDEGYCDADLLRIRGQILGKLGREQAALESSAAAVEKARARGAAGWQIRAARALEELRNQGRLA